MKLLLAALLAATSCVAVAQAQQPMPVNAGDGILTLDEAIVAAKNVAPQADASSADIAAAEAVRTEAGLRPNPTLSANIENVAGTGTYRGLNNVETTIAVAFPIERGGKRRARVDVANAELSRAQLSTAIALADVELATTLLYIEAVAAEQRLVIARDQARIATEGLRVANVRVRAGRASPLEEERANVIKITAETKVEQEVGSADAVRTNLERRLGGAVYDSALAFGITDLEALPAVRRDTGFGGFLAFPDKVSRARDLYFADNRAERAKHQLFYTSYPDTPSRDAARRLFLYRTFMQARRIAAAARGYAGSRILVVVGTMHKGDIEKILQDDPRIRIIQPSSIVVAPSANQVAALTRVEDLAAIANFNLLGLQSRGPNVDLNWMTQVVAKLRSHRPGPEADLFAVRLAELKKSEPSITADDYLALARSSKDGKFTWTGVKDRSRLDSYFDPFGNLSIASRALVEAARLHYAQCQSSAGDAIRDRLFRTQESDLRQYQFNTYWARYIALSPPAGGAGCVSTNK